MKYWSSDVQEYLAGDSVIEAHHPAVIKLSEQLKSVTADPVSYARAAFVWVRDEIRHSLDHGLNRVTFRASEVLDARTGICFAKANLLAALLRVNSIPAGLCYQRIRIGDRLILHGLVGVYLNGRWHRLDPRGDTTLLRSEFSLGAERLAYRIDETRGEKDFAWVFRQSHPAVADAFARSKDLIEIVFDLLPAELEPVRTAESRLAPYGYWTIATTPLLDELVLMRARRL